MFEKIFLKCQNYYYYLKSSILKQKKYVHDTMIIVMFAFLQCITTRSTFFISIFVYRAFDLHEWNIKTLKKMIYIAFGTKTRATFFQTIFDDNEFLQKISLIKSIIIYTVRNVTTNFLYM